MLGDYGFQKFVLRENRVGSKVVAGIKTIFAIFDPIGPTFLTQKTQFKNSLTFSSKLDWGSYIISIGKTASKKIGALICSMKFLSPEVALYLPL